MLSRKRSSFYPGMKRILMKLATKPTWYLATALIGRKANVSEAQNPMLRYVESDWIAWRQNAF